MTGDDLWLALQSQKTHKTGSSRIPLE